jgi:dTDP-4-dehydrorhamnose reductase
VINAAAYTAVDQAEREPERVFRVNAMGAEAVAAAAAQADAACLHISTDYVFSGDKSDPYLETDETGPTGVYGASKLEGEARVMAANPRAIVVRTAWVFDAQGKNFVRTMLRLAKSRPEVTVVADQRGCPTFADDLADALLTLGQQALARKSASRLYHCAGAGVTSWAQFAEAIFSASAAMGGPATSVRPIASSDYPTLAKRPANSSLNCARLLADRGVRIRSWTESLAQCVGEIAASGWRVE